MTDRRSRRFMIGWVLLSTLGLGAGIAAGLVLGGPIAKVVGMMLVTPMVTGLVGAVLGLGQWPHMRSLLVRPYLWVVASCLGLGAGLATGVVVVEQTGRLLSGHVVNVARLGMLDRALSFAVVGAISGLFLGMAESIVLRWQRVQVRSWLVTTTCALSLAFPLSSLAADSLFGSVVSPVGIVAFVLLAGLIFGVVTARPLQRAT